MIELHKKHGKLIRTSPNEVGVADLSAIKVSGYQYGPICAIIRIRCDCRGDLFKNVWLHGRGQGRQFICANRRRTAKRCLGITARHRRLRNSASSAIESRKTRGNDHDDMLDKLFAVHKEKLDEMTDTNVLSMVTSNIFAGSDITAISTRVIIYYLLKNHDCKKKLVEKLDEKKEEGQSSDPISLEQTKNMPYL
ncbi:hypothetical protein N7G274_003048 [Stereocaulon virgatum]|uniref:Cytochrome P450 n=1 Tax=Stereocaulon virgatum TaxID=373712 RepID=A0ABR4AGY5_9LECA